MNPRDARPGEVPHTLERTAGVGPAAPGAARAREVAGLTGVPEADVYGVQTFYSLLAEGEPVTRVCKGLSCRLRGSDRLFADLRSGGSRVEGVSCLGQCDRAPAALDPDLELRGADTLPASRVLPVDPDLPINLGGTEGAAYGSLARSRTLGPEAVIEAVALSGLQGRGGAGFPAARKWSAVRAAAGDSRYLVCNADEGEPGTFKDREVMVRRPHRLLEGMAIAAEAIGAREAWIYARGEFAEPARVLEAAIADAREGPLERLDVKVVRGHGAYICGEETALLESMEGRRGMPRIKPPYPTEVGLWGSPTLIHNVETLACVPEIVERGGQWFHDLGRTEPGSKLYCVSGHVTHPGVYELPLGVKLDELVEHAGGYAGKPVAFSPGGASSGFLPMDHRDRPLDFRTLADAGSMLGSAGVVVLNDTVDLVEAARWQAIFFEDETCGQCAPCRIGARLVRRAIDRYRTSGDPAELGDLEDLAWEMAEGSICGLGVAAPAPIRSVQRHFSEAVGPREPAPPRGGE